MLHVISHVMEITTRPRLWLTFNVDDGAHDMDTTLTISSILTSLQTHIQTQTQLLPTLHTQLGLPPSALVDELSSLQQRLADCVEKQIESRQREVDTWIHKCGGVEEECLRYSRALGPHIKIIGASVGELRKQHVLPVRQVT